MPKWLTKSERIHHSYERNIVNFSEVENSYDRGVRQGRGIKVWTIKMPKTDNK